MIRIETNGQRIELRGWVGPQTPALCKSVPGGRFHGDDAADKHWSYPLDTSTCRLLRTAFGADLAVGVELATWFKAQNAIEQEMVAIASSAGAELEYVPVHAPRIATAMANRTYQQVATAYGAKAGSFGLFDQPGLGKTIETLATIIEHGQGQPGGVHLVLCPKVAVEIVWAAEIRQWLGADMPVYALTGDRARREDILFKALNDADEMSNIGYPGGVFVIANIEMARITPWVNPEGKKVFKVEADSYVRPATAKTPAKLIESGAEYPDLFGITWTTIVADESHRAVIKSASGPTNTREGFKRLKADRRIALSGTPMRGKPHQLWGTLNWLRPDKYTSYWKWVERYFTVSGNRYSNFVVDGTFKRGGEERLALDIRSEILRRTKQEVLPELPPKQYAGTYLIPGDDNSPHGVWVGMDPKQERQYQQLLREGAVIFDDGDELIANGVLAQGTRQKQIAGACMTKKGVPLLPSPKFDWLVEKLTELGIMDGEGDGKIVVASHFTQLLNLFAEELTKLGVSLHLLTGETPERKRVAMVQDFQSDQLGTRVFLLNTQAGGVAVTLDAADDLVLLDETYIPDDQEQVEDRIHRTSRMHSVTIHYLRTLDTIEEEIGWITAARENVQKYLLDGVRGVDVARKIYEAKAAA